MPSNHTAVTIDLKLDHGHVLSIAPHCCSAQELTKAISGRDRSVFLCFVLFFHKLVTRTELGSLEKECYPYGVNRYINTNCLWVFCIMKGKNVLSQRSFREKWKGKKNNGLMEKDTEVLWDWNRKIKAVDFRLRQSKPGSGGRREAEARHVQDARNKEDSQGCSCIEKQTEHTSVERALSETPRGDMGRGIVRN